MAETHTVTIARLNDKLRVEGVGGKILATIGVQNLSHSVRADVIRAVCEFSNFDSGSDPYNEHDFGSIQVNGETYFFKVDYYGADYMSGSPDPADPEVTHRVMTIMRADEY